MRPEEYRSRLSRIRLGPVDVVVAMVRALARLTPRRPPSESQRRMVADEVYSALIDARRLAARAALEWYAAADPVRRRSPNIPAPDYPPSAVDSFLSRTVWKPLEAAAQSDAGITPKTWQDAQRAAAAAAARHSDAAARDVTSAAVMSDRRAVGYARMLVGAVNCAFCTMLASRGPVYKSRGSAGEIAATARWPDADPAATINRYHDGCDCIVVPVFDVHDWIGRDEYEALESKWIRVTRDYYAADKARAWRRYQDALNRAAEKDRTALN